MPAVPQQFRRKRFLNPSILPGYREKHPRGDEVGEHRQAVVAFAPDHIAASQPYHVVEAQPGMRRLHVGEKHPPHPRVVLIEILPARLTGIALIWVRAKASNSWVKCLLSPSHGGDAVHFAAIGTSPPRQRTHDHALLVKDVKMPSLDRLDVVATNHRSGGARAFFRPQPERLLNLQHQGRGACPKPQLNNSPTLPRPNNCSKGC